MSGITSDSYRDDAYESDLTDSTTTSNEEDVYKNAPPSPPKGHGPDEDMDSLETKFQGALQVFGSRNTGAQTDHHSQSVPLQKMPEQQVDSSPGEPIAFFGTNASAPFQGPFFPAVDFSFKSQEVPDLHFGPLTKVFGNSIDQGKVAKAGATILDSSNPVSRSTNPSTLGPTPVLRGTTLFPGLRAAALLANPMPTKPSAPGPTPVLRGSTLFPESQAAPQADSITNHSTPGSTPVLRGSSLFPGLQAAPGANPMPTKASAPGPTPVLRGSSLFPESQAAHLANPTPAKLPTVPEAGPDKIAPPSSKRQVSYLHPPDDDADYATSPTKRMFGHRKGPDTVPTHIPATEKNDGSGRQAPPLAGPDGVPGAPGVKTGPWELGVFLQAIEGGTELDKDDRDFHVKHLSLVHQFFSTFTDDVVVNTRAVVHHERTIAERNVEIKTLEEARLTTQNIESTPSIHIDEINGELTVLNVELDEAVRRLATARATTQTHKAAIMTQLSGAIQTLLRHYRTRFEAATCSEKDLDAKNELINRLRLATLNLEEELKTAKSSLKVSNETVKQLQIQLQDDETKIASVTRSLQVSHRDRLDQVFAEHKTDKKEALNLQKEQYTTQIKDAESKFRMYKEANARMETLSNTVQRLEREKTDALLAKAALEKELEDIKLQATQWRTFEDAYKQVKTELDQLTGDLNDAVAERDDLRKTLEASYDAPRAQSTTVEPMATAQPTKGVGALKSYDQDLALLETFWLRQQRFAEMAKREMQAEVDEVDQEIAEIERELAAFNAPEAENPEPDAETESPSEQSHVAPVESPAPAAQIENAHQRWPELLDTLPSPAPWNTSGPAPWNTGGPAPWNTDGPAPTPVPNPGPTYLAKVPQIGGAPSQRTATKPLSYAARAAGRIAPATGHKRNAHSLTYNSSSYTPDPRRKVASTAQKVGSSPLKSDAGVFRPG